MTPRERLQAEWRLTQERLARVSADHDGFVEASRDSNADDEHDPEGATIAFERSQVETHARRLQQHLTEVSAALQRLEDGMYGVCLRCGEPIPEERLDARPAAPTCVGCAS